MKYFDCKRHLIQSGNFISACNVPEESKLLSQIFYQIECNKILGLGFDAGDNAIPLTWLKYNYQFEYNRRGWVRLESIDTTFLRVGSREYRVKKWLMYTVLDSQ